MKEFGQSIVKGGFLLVGFVVLVVILTSLPGGKPASPAPQQVAPSSNRPSSAAPASVPSAIRGVTRPDPTPISAPAPEAAPVTASPSSSTSQRRRADSYSPVETQAQMENRIKQYLKKRR